MSTSSFKVASGSAPVGLHVEQLRLLLTHATERYEQDLYGNTEEPPAEPGPARLAESQARDLRGRLLEQIQQIDGLPTLPVVLSKLDQVLADPRSGAPDIARVLELDPGLASTMLRLVNSSVFGLRREVRAMDQVVVYLGVSQVRSLAMTASVFKAFPGTTTPSFDPLLFWSHSLTAGIAARLLAQALIDNDSRAMDPEEAFLAGLLHDIGKIALAGCQSETYEQTHQLMLDHGMPCADAELCTMGITHSEIGAHLLKRWGVPAPIVDAVAAHHEPVALGLPAFVVHLADHVSRGLGFLPDVGAAPTLVPTVWSTLGLADTVIEQLAYQTLADFGEAREIMDPSGW